MREETERPDERVLRRLRRQENGSGVTPMLEHLAGRLSASELSYEDWVRPLKLTGGRVCLRVDEPGMDETIWFRRGGNGDLVGLNDGIRSVGPRAVVCLKTQMADRLRTITPVPVEATPFAEADDA